MTLQDFALIAATHKIFVSRETLEKFEVYGALLTKWQSKINLVSSHTVERMWNVHFWDSAQLARLLPTHVRTHVDMGSGAGFPGLVLALLGVAQQTVLFESDQRKTAFLREVARQTDAPVRIICDRIEKSTACRHDVDLITARALAALDKLLSLAWPLSHTHTECVFPKGENVEAELTHARKYWMFKAKPFRGLADNRTTILRISDVSRRSACSA